jgi:hypothetical protein
MLSLAYKTERCHLSVSLRIVPCTAFRTSLSSFCTVPVIVCMCDQMSTANAVAERVQFMSQVLEIEMQPGLVLICAVDWTTL